MKSAAKSATELAPAAAPDNPMHELLDLLGERANVLHELSLMQIEADRLLQMQARKVQKDHTDFSELVALLETEIEALVRRHPEWFAKRKSVPTPFGTPTLRHVTSLEINDEPRTLELVLEKLDPKCERFVRLVPTLDLEALEKLTDERLLEYGIRRVTEDKFSIAAVKVPLPKAVEAAAVTKEGKR